MITLTRPLVPRHVPLSVELRSGISQHIGQTPLIPLKHVTAFLPETVQVWAKAEYLNPGGSVKDRAALQMIREGLKTGELRAGKTLLDATSGNTGIAYAMLGAALKIPVKLAMPANASAARKQILHAYGVELILTDPMEGTDGAQRFVRDLADRQPDRYFYPDQYNNPANWQAHFEHTGREILQQTDERLTHFIAALGTTGTFMGVSRRLRQHLPEVQCLAVQPDSPLHGLEGVKHLETAIVPGIYNPDEVDQRVTISTESAFSMTRRLAQEEGLLVGISSGANVAAALQIAQDLDEGLVVTILCDAGTRYLGEFFNDEVR